MYVAIIPGVSNCSGKMVSNSAQWVMNVCTANADVVISPTIIIALSTIVFVFSTLEAAMDYWDPRESKGHEQE